MIHEYRATIEIETKRQLSMQLVCDAIADALESLGLTELEYDVLVKGPTELSLRVL